MKIISKSTLYYQLTATITLYNPANMLPISNKSYYTNQQIHLKLNKAQQAHHILLNLTPAQKVHFARSLIKKVCNNKQQLRKLIMQSVGKSYQQIQKQFRRIELQINRIIDNYDPAPLQKRVANQNLRFTYSNIGKCLLFPYFSNPLLNTLQIIVPSILLSNPCLLFPPLPCPYIGEFFQGIVQQIGVQYKGIINQLFLKNQSLDEFVGKINMVGYYGDKQQGKYLRQVVGNKDIQVNMFFGGKDIFYIHYDANIKTAIKDVTQLFLQNNGQDLQSVKFLLVDKRVYKEVVNQLSKINVKIGHPQNKECTLGIPKYQEQLSKVQQYIQEAVQGLGQIVLGGTLQYLQGNKGRYLKPTIISGVHYTMSIVQQKCLAPILCLNSIDSQAELTHFINHSPVVGLAIYSGNCEQIYQKIRGKIKPMCISFNQGNLLRKMVKMQGYHKRYRHFSSEIWDEMGEKTLVIQNNDKQ